jgi:hypothetical protein
VELERGLLERALRALGDVLGARGHRYDLVAIGGSGLLLLELGVRPTKDLDVIALIDDHGYRMIDELPVPLAQAAADVALTYGLSPDWINPGPASLLELGLPEGFDQRTQTRTFGTLVIRVAGRRDQIFFKLYAGADMGPDSKHIRDLEGLQPTEEELIAAARWAVTHDPSRGFRSVLLRSLEYFGVADAETKL